MNRTQHLKYAVAELAKAQKRISPKANLYHRDPMNNQALEKDYQKYKELAEVISYLEELAAQRELF